MNYVKKLLDDRDSFRINKKDKEIIDKASQLSGIDKGAIYRESSIKEAKRILKKIEKGE